MDKYAGWKLKISKIKVNASLFTFCLQAFGVGVYEEDDEDIYTNFDLNQYDFEIGATTSQITNVPKCRNK